MATQRSRVEASSWERYALVSGIVFVALQLLILGIAAVTLLPNLPGPGGAAADYPAAYVEYARRLLVINYLLTVPIPFFLFFVAGLFVLLRRIEGDGGVLAVAALAAGVTMAMIWPLGAVLPTIGVFIAEEGGDPATIAALDAMAPMSLALSAMPRTLLLAAVAVLLLHRAAAPRWVGWAAAVLAVLSFLGTLTLMVGEFFPLLALGTLLFELWVLAFCVALLRRSSASTEPVPARSPSVA